MAEPSYTLPRFASRHPRREALKALRSFGDSPRAITALLERGESVLSANPPLAHSLAEAARLLGEQGCDRSRTAYAIRLRGHASKALERHEEALQDYATSRRRFLNAGNALEAARTLIGRVDALMYLDRLEEALRVGKRALREFRSLGEEERAGRVLMNLGNLEYRRDRPLQALNRYREARTLLDARAAKIDRAFVDYNIANILVQLGDPDEAEKQYRSVLEIAQGAGHRLLTLHVKYALSAIDAMRGHYASALRNLETCEREFEELSHERGRCNCLLDRAEIYERLSLYPECQHAAEEAARGFRALGLSMETTRARFFVSIGAIGSGNVRQGSVLGRKTATEFRRLKNTSQAAAVQLRLAQRDSSTHRSWVHRCERLLRAARSHLRREGLEQLATEVQIELSRLAFRSGNTARAKSRLALANRELSNTGRPDLRARSEHLQVLIHERRSDVKEAYEHALECLAEMDRMCDRLDAAELVAAHFFRLAGVYQDVLRTAVTRLRSEPRALYELVERIEQARDLPSVPSAASAERVAAAAIDKLRERLTMLTLQAQKELPDSRRWTSRSAEIRRAERALLERVRRARLRPSSERRGAAPILGLRSLQEALCGGDLWIHLIDLGESVGTLAVTRESAAVLEGSIPKAEIRKLLRRFQYQSDVLRVQALRDGPRFAELKRSADHVLGQIAALCLPPLARHLERCDRILVRPAAGFEVIPWGALPWKGSLLWDRAVVHILPGVPSLRAQPERSPSRDEIARNATLWACGDLDAALEEVRRVVRILGAGEVFMGDRASSGAFLKSAPGASLIHFAGHGEFRQDNPLFSSLRFVDREVTFLDLEGYTMSAALVVLSSCSSGGVRPDLGFGAGISRGFLRAGAKALLVSLWRIGDQETLGFMEAFYESLAKTGSAGEALREAALRSRSDGRHPADWAAFQVVGLA